ncbi:hypothetical protein [Nostoc sp. MS1]|uniref:hypothetical protein n=1 Tax=Nostoc sp. MS1 TaxID=2764711 RepID=UPI001CC45462|nr:hypothetical protein [Nostoc sp. MS1]
MSKHHSLWEKLNERQQATLTAIYRADQSAEADQKQAWDRGSTRVPAAVCGVICHIILNPQAMKPYCTGC